MNIHRFTLKSPIWGGRKNMKIGIAAFRLKLAPVIEVDCIYTTKDGNRTFARVFRIASSKVAKPLIHPQKGTMIHEVPIEEFEEIALV